MEEIDNNCVKTIYNFIPLNQKKYVNKEGHQNFLNSIYPSRKEDWYPIEVYGKDFSGSVNNMFQFIISNNLQEWFQDFEPDSDKGYMWSSSPIIDKISNGVEDDCHSGATFGYCLRIMQDIFKNNNIKKWTKPYK